MNWKFVIRSWQAAYLLAVVAIIFQPSTPTVWLGRYSNTSFVILCLLILIALPLFRILRWLENNVNDLRLSKRLLIGIVSISLFVFILIWQLPIGPTISYQIIQILIVYGLTSIILWAAFHLELEVAKPIVIITIAILGVITIFLAADYPGMLWVDEGFMASLANGIRQTGTLHLTYYEPYEKELFSLSYVGLASWYDVFGFSFGSGRIYIFVISLFTILVTHFTVRRVYSVSTGWFVVALGLIPALSLNVYRQDVEVGLLIAIGLYIMVLAVDLRRSWLHVLVGFFFGFSLDGHPNAYRLGFSIGIAYLVEFFLLYFRFRKINILPVIFLLIGGVLGAGLYIGIWSVYSDTFLVAASEPNFQLNLFGSVAVIGEYLRYALDLMPLLTLTTCIGIVAIIIRGEQFERNLLVILVASTLILGVVFGYVRTYYLIHSLPIFLLISGFAIFQIEKILSHNGRSKLIWFLLLITVLSSTSLLINMVQTEPSNNYDLARVVARDLRQYLKPTDRIVGVDPLYFELSDYPHFVDISVAGWRANFGDIDQIGVWEQIAPNAIIVFRSYPSPYPQSIFDYMSEYNFVLRQCWSSRELGQVDLYVIDDATSVSTECIQI